jgi:hypothetical protein
MKGELVPVVMLPRFTSYLGEGSFATAPMPVEAYQNIVVTFWRGPLVGGDATTPFEAFFEVSHDAYEWEVVEGPIDDVNTSGKFDVELTKRWFRVRIELLGDANGVVGLSMWMAGVLQRTVR